MIEISTFFNSRGIYPISAAWQIQLPRRIKMLFLLHYGSSLKVIAGTSRKNHFPRCIHLQRIYHFPATKMGWIEEWFYCNVISHITKFDCYTCYFQTPFQVCSSHSAPMSKRSATLIFAYLQPTKKIMCRVSGNQKKSNFSHRSKSPCHICANIL